MARLAGGHNAEAAPIRGIPTQRSISGSRRAAAGGATTTKTKAHSNIIFEDGDEAEPDAAIATIEAQAREQAKPITTPGVRKRRVLGQRSDNPLLMPFGRRDRNMNIGKENDEQDLVSAQLFAEARIHEPAPRAVPRVRESRARAVKQNSRETSLDIDSGDEEHTEDDSENDTGTGEEEAEDSSLSDFVVDDSDASEDAASSSDDDLFQPPSSPPQPKPRRRLVRGIRPQRDEGHRQPSQPTQPSQLSSTTPLFAPQKSKAKETDELTKTLENLKLEDDEQELREAPEDSDFDEPMPVLKYSPPKSRKPKKVMGKTRFTTPPPSPSKTGEKLLSPRKLPTIPNTPHRQSTDAFWNQDTVNEWNDEYSPHKELKPLSRSPLKKETEAELFQPSPKKQVAKRDKLMAQRKKTFEAEKHKIAEDFLAELDREITNNEISDATALTGGIQIIWSKKLNTTAGRANWRREHGRMRVPQGEESAIVVRHFASIELAEKVIDDEERLLNVLAHEFCHLANFIVSGIKDNPHGKEFKAWAAQVSRKFGHRGIEVTTKHSYEIDFKYIWECSECHLEYKRHSKSIDPIRHRCGSCKGTLNQMKPVPRAAGGKTSEYQTFVKENFAKIKLEMPGSPQKDIMALVGKRYREQKEGKVQIGVRELPVLSREGSSSSTASSLAGGGSSGVVRKLDFVDLTL